MKKIVIIVVLIPTSIFGYSKFRCADYMQVSQTGNNICSLIAHKIAPTKSAAHYIMQDSFGISYVYLSASDKKRVMHALSRYQLSQGITSDLIHEFTPSARKRKHVVGLVLQDFAMLNQQATVHDVLNALTQPQK